MEKVGFKNSSGVDTEAQFATPLPVQVHAPGAYTDDSAATQVGMAAAGSSTTSPMASGEFAHNGINWEKRRNNIGAEALASAARTATTNSADLTNNSGRGVKVFINVTAAAAPSVTFSIQAKDPSSGTYTALLTSAAIVGTGHTILTLYPGVTATANVSASDVLPRTWRIVATHGNANSITYSVGYSTIL